MPVNKDGRRAIENLISWHREKYGKLDVKRPLFPSRNKSGSVAMNRQTAHEMLKKAFEDAGLNGKLATHSLRKSFAQRLYEESGDIYLCRSCLVTATSPQRKNISVSTTPQRGKRVSRWQ